MFLSVHFDLQATIWWSCLGGAAAVTPLSNASWNLGLFKNVLNVKTSICCLGGIMQHPSAQAAQESLGMGAHRGIFALPNSLPKWNQFMQSSDVIFLFPLRSCPSSSLKFSGLLVIKTSHLGWDMALKSSFPHHLRKSAQWGEPLQSPSLFICWWAWRKISKNAGNTFKPSRRLCLAPVLTLWDTTVAVLSGNHSLFTGALLNLSRSLSLFILPKYTAWEYKNQRSGAVCQQYVIYNSKVLFTRVVECDLNM